MMENTLRDKIINYVLNNPNVKMKRYEMANYLGVSRPALSIDRTAYSHSQFEIFYLVIDNLSAATC